MRRACGEGQRRDVRLMISKQDTLSFVTSALPGRDSLIERAYRENRSFRGLCRDYRECAEALERWRRSEVSESSSRVREYGELLRRWRRRSSPGSRRVDFDPILVTYQVLLR